MEKKEASKEEIQRAKLQLLMEMFGQSPSPQPEDKKSKEKEKEKE